MLPSLMCYCVLGLPWRRPRFGLRKSRGRKKSVACWMVETGDGCQRQQKQTHESWGKRMASRVHFSALLSVAVVGTWLLPSAEWGDVDCWVNLSVTWLLFWADDDRHSTRQRHFWNYLPAVFFALPKLRSTWKQEKLESTVQLMNKYIVS